MNVTVQAWEKMMQDAIEIETQAVCLCVKPSGLCDNAIQLYFTILNQHNTAVKIIFNIPKHKLKHKNVTWSCFALFDGLL